MARVAISHPAGPVLPATAPNGQRADRHSYGGLQYLVWVAPQRSIESALHQPDEIDEAEAAGMLARIQEIVTDLAAQAQVSMHSPELDEDEVDDLNDPTSQLSVLADADGTGGFGYGRLDAPDDLLRPLGDLLDAATADLADRVKRGVRP